MKANSKVGEVVSIQLVDDTTGMMVISQFGKLRCSSARHQCSQRRPLYQRSEVSRVPRSSLNAMSGTPPSRRPE